MSDTVYSGLPAAERTQLRVGFLRLTDSAPLIIAKEMGYFQRFGLDVELCEEVSWANLRDKLATGVLDAAPMLAPLPAMTAYGVSGIRVSLVTGLVLSRNGNALTVGRSLWRRLTHEGATPLSEGLRNHLESGAKLTLATVHSFSTHTLLIRRWLRSIDIDPEQVRLVIVPPSQMPDSLATGAVDGYCAGEPWNTISVQQGVGIIAATGQDIWPDAPEKVLCVLEDWNKLYPATHLRLRLALMGACEWLNADNRSELTAALLARDSYLRLPQRNILPALAGELGQSPRGVAQEATEFHSFDPLKGGCPSHDQLAALVKECAPLIGREIDDERCLELAQQVGRPDLFVESTDWLDRERMHLGAADA